jgi:hypothetical protein
MGAAFIAGCMLILSTAMFGMRGAAKDWHGEGVIVSHGTGQSLTIAVFALVWNAFAFPAAWLIYQNHDAHRGAVERFVLIFPIIGVFLFLTAAYQLLRSYKYRQSRLMLAHLPISVGVPFRGEIVTHVKARPENGFVLKLLCVRRAVTGFGRSRRITETEIWSETQRISPAALIPTVEGTHVPFAFEIPGDALPASDPASTEQILWRLDAAAETSGIDYAAQFELPVFRTAETPVEVRRFTAAGSEALSWMPAAGSGITITPRATGGDDVRIAAHARLLESVPLLIFIAIGCATVSLMVEENVTLLIPIFFGAFGFLLIIGWIDSVIGGTTIRADQKGLRVRRLWLGVPIVSRTIMKERITAIVATATPNASYYDVNAIHSNEKRDGIASYLRTRKDAEMLAARLRHDVDLKS